MMESVTKFKMEKFDGKGDFGMWKFKMLMQLELQGLGKVLEDESAEESSSEKDDSDSKLKAKEELDPKAKEKDTRVRNLICSSLTNIVLRKVMKEQTAKGVWKALEADYQTKTLPNRIYLKQSFASFKMSEQKSIEENLDGFLKLVDDLASLNILVSDEDQAIQVLSSLPPQYDSLVHTLKYGNSKETLTLKEVTTSAYSKEAELREKGLVGKTSSAAEGLFATRGNNERRQGGKEGRGRSKSRDTKFRKNSRSQTPAKAKECWVCGSEGHFKRDCPERKDGNKQQNANVAQRQEPMILTASVHDTRDQWVLDSGCTFHITPDKDALFDFEEVDGGKVLMGNNTYSEVTGIGKLKIINPDKTEVILTNVRYMPSMGRNLISFGQLEKSGCSYEGSGFNVTFSRKGKRVISGTYREGLYFLNGSVQKGTAAIARPEIDTTRRWHSRLGHMGLKCMNELVKGGYLDGKEVHTLDFCEECVLGKAQKQSFQEGKHTSKKPLEYIHSDLWGSPSVEESLAGSRYFITFIDDYSRKVWISFLRSKDEAFQSFKEWKLLVENQTGKRVKCLRTDNGLEFCNKAFDELCKNSGIKRHKTCAYTPQQNGVAERMNRTIMNKVRSMLAETGFGKQFWAETASTAVYLINHSPTSALSFKIPEEVWSGRKVTLNHLRRFGCEAFVHTVQDKVSPRATKGYFLGYPQGVKGYRVWMPEEGKCTISRNVVFHEDKVFKDKVEKGNSETKQNKKGKQVSFRFDKTSEDTESGGVFPETGTEASRSEVTESENSDVEPDEQEEAWSDQPETSTESLSDYVLARDRAKRVIKKPSMYEEGSDYVVAYALLCAQDVEIEEPKTVAEARRSKYWKHWRLAMKEEIDSLAKNSTWLIVEKPRKKKIVGCKWIFKYKEGIPGVEPPRFKARLVAKGFTQIEGVDYNEIFSPVVKHVSIRLLLSVVVNFDMELEQLDVKTAFLHGTLDEEIYMNQPEGFIEKENESKVCLLKRSLYGLKQSPRQWNQRFDEFMKRQGYSQSVHDPCVYFKGKTLDEKVFLLLYVDDMLVASKDMRKIQRLKESLKSEFEMKDLGKATRILGMDILRDRKKGLLKLSQGKYLRQVLKNFNMEGAKPVVTPVSSQHKLRRLTEAEIKEEASYMDKIPYASAVGSLMYAMIGSRPDLGFAICLISRYMSQPGRTHWDAVRWVFKYLTGALDMCLTFTKQEMFDIVGYSDSDYNSDLDRRRSVSAYIFQVGGNTVSWRATLQSVVALSTTEAEYMALTEAAKEGKWLMMLCGELGFEFKSYTLYCDAQSAICLAKNAVHHGRTKHMDTKYHFIRDKVQEGSVNLLKVHTTLNAADFLTKCLPGPAFQKGLELAKILA